MVVRVGGMYGRKRTLGYPKSYDSGSKAAGTAAPSVGRYAVQRTACPRQGTKAAFDGRNGCQKCFYIILLLEKVTKLAPYPALITRIGRKDIYWRGQSAL